MKCYASAAGHFQGSERALKYLLEELPGGARRMSKVSKESAISRLKEILIKDRQAVQEAEKAEQTVTLRVAPAS
jgi:hypothetical protein